MSTQPKFRGLFQYRRPNLQWTNSTTVHVEDQIVTGVSGDVTALFSDGKYLTVNSATQTDFVITRNAVLSGSKQSGLRTGSVANNTWYALYLVRATDNDNTFVTVGDTVFPVNSSISTLNTNFGVGKWLYIGTIRYGDNSNFPSAILNFTQVGNRFYFGPQNASFNYGGAYCGIVLAINASTTQVTYTTSFGSGATQIAPNISLALWGVTMGIGTGTTIDGFVALAFNNHVPFARGAAIGNDGYYSQVEGIANYGVLGNLSSTGGITIFLNGFVDNALGVGSNPVV